MSAYRIHLIALLVSMAALGCKTNSNYCPGANTNNNCTEIDAAPTRCTSPADCSGSTGVCKLETGMCVQCTATDFAACTGMTPICGTDNACRRCTAHSECVGSEVCLPSGECSNGTDTAYVEANKTGTQCTQAAPCPTITAALGKKPYIKVKGTIRDSVSVDSLTEKILAAPGAMLISSGAVAIEVRGTSDLEIYDLVITNPKNGGIGISVPAGNNPTVSLHRATVSNSEGGGIVAGGGTLNITQSTLSGNSGGGVLASGGGTLNITQSTLSGNSGGGVLASGGGTLNIRRSEISSNSGGGIIMTSTSSATAMSFRIRNNFIFKNGKSGLDFTENGGIRARAITGSNSIIEFNTIVYNQAGSGAARTAGVDCDGGANVRYNIIVQNSSVSGSQIAGGCGFSSSFTATVPNPKFVDLNKDNYRLTADTPAPDIRDAVACPTGLDAITEDYDGDSRPPSGRCDFGADEYRAP